MRPDAFEREVRKVMDDVEYRPSEQSWQKLHQALLEGKEATTQPLAAIPSKRKSLMPIINWAVAATFVGVLATGAYMLFLNNDVPTTNKNIAQATLNSNKPSAIKGNISNQNDANNAASVNPQQAVASTTSQQLLAHFSQSIGGRNQVGGGSDFQQILSTANINPRVELLASHKVNNNALQFVDGASVNVAQWKALAPVQTWVQKAEKISRTEDLGSKLYNAFDWSDNPEDLSKFEDPFVYGVALKAGLPTVGAMRFKVGLTAKKDWNDKLFTEANLDVSYTDVRYKKALYYKKNDNGSLSNLGDNSNMAASNSTKTEYTNTVMGLGLSATIGYNLNDKFSIAVGADMYRNFNNALILKDNNPIVEKTTLKNTVAPVKWINVWDAGALAQVKYSVTEHVDVVAQYRKGLVNYMMDTEGNKVKNSSLSLGLNLKFNP